MSTRARHRTHPLRLFFDWRRWPWAEAMQWLQDRGWISDNCITPEDVALCDIRRVLAAAGASHALSTTDPQGQCGMKGDA